MQLTFPNGEHEAVPLEGDVTVGSRGARVVLPAHGLAPVKECSWLPDSPQGSVVRLA